MESDGKLRLLRLLELLRTESDELHPISIAQITAMMKERWGLDAYRITIQKDVEALRAAGYEIETIRSTQNRYYLTSRAFELPELKLLLDAVESSKFITQKKSRVLASKLLTPTSRHTAAGSSAISLSPTVSSRITSISTTSSTRSTRRSTPSAKYPSATLPTHRQRGKRSKTAASPIS